MRLYSNKLLTWPNIFHATQCAKAYTGQWATMNFYTIQKLEPLTIKSYSPLYLLEENNKYYCYYYYNRDYSHEILGNSPWIYKNKAIYLPTLIQNGDIVVINK